MQPADIAFAPTTAGVATGDAGLARIWIRFEPLDASLLWCSAALASRMGHRDTDWRGLTLRVFADAVDWAEQRGPWQALLRGEDLDDQPLRVIGRDGRCRLMSASATVLPAGDTGPATGLLVLDEVGPRWQRDAACERDRLRLRTLAYEVTMAEARERERLANDLHDELGQLLAIVQFRLGELAAAAGADADAFGELRDLLTQAARATRSATFDLHSPLLQQLGLQAAIESLGERLARQARLTVTVQGRLASLPLNTAVQAVLLRVVRELLANAGRHAQANSVALLLHSDERRLVVTISDDGQGFDLAARRRSPGRDGGFGLVSAEAQMQAIGGRLDLQSTRGQGTTARLSLELAHVGGRGH